MQRATRSILYALLFLFIAELGVRRAAGSRTETWKLDAPLETPLVILLGSSRTERALVPRRMERELAQRGVGDVWVASITEHGVTAVGLFKQYVKVLRPIVRQLEEPEGWIGIELRATGVNDNYMQAGERDFLSKLAADPEEGAGLVEFQQSSGGASPTELLRHVGDGEFELAAQSLLWRLHFARGSRVLLPALRRNLRLSALDTSEGLTEEELFAGWARVYPEWAAGSKGWAPFTTAPLPNRNLRIARRSHAELFLRDYAVGGVQVRALKQLVKEIRHDGLEPFFYMLPVTELYRGQYPPGRYAAVLQRLERIAERKRVPCFNLDTDHVLPLDAFHDTHHLRRESAREFSGRFALDVLAPLLD